MDILPGAPVEAEEKPVPVSSQSIQESVEAEQQYDVEAVDPMGLLGTEENQAAGGRADNHPLQALLGPGGFPQLLDMPPGDDEAVMVELAIALSLQDQQRSGDNQGSQQGFQQGLANIPGLQGLENLSGPEFDRIQALAVQGLSHAVERLNVAVMVRSFNLDRRLMLFSNS